MESEELILRKLMVVIKDACVRPIPSDEYLVKRIQDRMESFDSLRAGGENSDLDLSNFASPVCFSADEEVQADYRLEDLSLSRIDDCIDELIQKMADSL
ncbi:hypothetical protein ACPUEN_03455 [Algoriphagus yeomjeoni]|uniref:hypothetical protein n=1 Tax=Algoriphagus yeomjeoni TaxID=291403 RepID=UPI003CE4C04B